MQDEQTPAAWAPLLRDPESPMPARRDDLTETLRRRITGGLRAGTLRAGERLPSARELEKDFDTDHRLILDAYRRLAREGLVEVRERGGIYVATAHVPGALPPPAEDWLVEVLAEGVARDLPVASVIEWFRRATETLRLRAVIVQATRDQVVGMCRALEEDFGFVATGMESAELEAALAEGRAPADIGRAHLLVTTAAHEAVVRRAAAAGSTPVLIATVRPDVIGGEWRLIMRKSACVIVADPRFSDFMRRYLAGAPGAEHLRFLVVGRDDLRAIPRDAYTYVTRAARELIGDQPLPGRVLPPARVFSSDTTRELLHFIVRANIAVHQVAPA